MRAALGAILPFGYYLLVGALQHFVLRLFGSRRPLRDSCAMALYAGGGPASAARILMGICAVVAVAEHGAWIVMVGAVLSFSLFFYTLSAALGGLHFTYRIRWWHILIANLVAMFLSGLLFGALHPPGSYGLHLVISVGGVGRDWSFGVSD
jgi:hypothetical protein